MKYSLHAAKLIDAYLTLAALGNVYGAEDVREVIAYLEEHRHDTEGPEGDQLLQATINYLQSGII